jgi:hypothetical protein
MEDRDLIPGRGRIYFDTISRLALEPAQFPIKYVPGESFTGIKRQGREADHSTPIYTG